MIDGIDLLLTTSWSLTLIFGFSTIVLTTSILPATIVLSSLLLPVCSVSIVFVAVSLFVIIAEPGGQPPYFRISL